jgi:PAS domain-containing protein
VEPWAIVAVLLAVLASGLALLAARQGRTLDAVGRQLQLRAGEDPGPAARRLRDDLIARDRELATAREGTSRLLESVGPGVLTLDGGLRVVEANHAAHALLDRPPGALLGRTVMEAFLDTSVESTARTALELGAAACG